LVAGEDLNTVLNALIANHRLALGQKFRNLPPAFPTERTRWVYHDATPSLTPFGVLTPNTSRRVSKKQGCFCTLTYARPPISISKGGRLPRPGCPMVGARFSYRTPFLPEPIFNLIELRAARLHQLVQGWRVQDGHHLATWVGRRRGNGRVDR
jgi:hypothetical protein